MTEIHDIGVAREQQGLTLVPEQIAEEVVVPQGDVTLEQLGFIAKQFIVASIANTSWDSLAPAVKILLHDEGDRRIVMQLMNNAKITVEVGL